MYHIIKNWKITDSSENYLSIENWTTIQKDFTQEEILLISKWYSYNIETEEFEETKESKEFEAKILEDKKTSILKELWELKQIKDWMELVWEDTTEITNQINDLITEYKTL